MTTKPSIDEIADAAHNLTIEDSTARHSTNRNGQPLNYTFNPEGIRQNPAYVYHLIPDHFDWTDPGDYNTPAERAAKLLSEFHANSKTFVPNPWYTPTNGQDPGPTTKRRIMAMLNRTNPPSVDQLEAG